MSDVVGLRPGEPVEWGRLDERTFTRLVEALVQVEYRETAAVEPIDGRGGDGGADIRIRHHDGRIEILQLKFYPEGFDGKHSGRRSKIRESLSRALTEQADMTHWTLVFPAVPTGPGWTYLKALAGDDVEAVVGWWTRAALDALCSRHPSVVRAVARRGEYFLDTLKAARLESEALATSADLITRVAGLASLGEDMDPNWAIDFKSVNGVRTQMLRAKHPNAADVSPITITPTFQFGPSDEDLRAQVERVFGFGANEELVLPGRVLADLRVEGPSWLTLPSAEESEEIRFLTALPEGDGEAWPPLDITLHAGGDVLGTHRGTIRHVGRGSQGMTVDASVHKQCTVSFVLPDDQSARGTMQLSLDLTGASAYDARKAVRFIRDLVGSDQLELTGDGKSFGSLRGDVPAERVTAADELAWAEEAASDLLSIEEALGVNLEFRAELSLFDRIDLRILALLIAGRCVLHHDVFKMNVSFHSPPEQPEIEKFLRGEPGALVATYDDITWTVLGQKVRLPQLAIYHPSARMVTPTGGPPLAGDDCTIEASDGTPGRLYLPDRMDPDGRVVPTPWRLTGIPEPIGFDQLAGMGDSGIQPRRLGARGVRQMNGVTGVFMVRGSPRQACAPRR